MDGESLRDAYKLLTHGECPPTSMTMSGAMLNQDLQTDRYEPDRLYTVTRRGIMRPHRNMPIRLRWY